MKYSIITAFNNNIKLCKSYIQKFTADVYVQNKQHIQLCKKAYLNHTAYTTYTS